MNASDTGVPGDCTRGSAGHGLSNGHGDGLDAAMNGPRVAALRRARPRDRLMRSLAVRADLGSSGRARHTIRSSSTI